MLPLPLIGPLKATPMANKLLTKTARLIVVMVRFIVILLFWESRCDYVGAGQESNTAHAGS